MNYQAHPMTLRQLQYVVAVADTLSFRGAAERCHVSQPSLSAQVAELEEAIGVRLFERDRRGVLITPAGSDLIEHARTVLREADALVDLARRSSDPLAGTLRIGVIPTISPYLLPQLTRVLRETYPRLTTRWTEDKTEVLVERLERGTLEAAVMAEEADIGNVSFAELGFDPFVLATSENHPLGNKKGPARPGELDHEDVLLLDEGHCFRDQALEFCAGADARELEFRATSLSTLAQMVADGAGVTLLPEMAVPVEAQRAGLRIRPFKSPAPGRSIILAWRRGSHLEPVLQQVAETLRTLM